MPVPANVILVWTGTNAAIPSGWTRETTLDGRYAKGTAAGVNPNVNGGAANHSHTSSAHSHTLDGHSHNVVTDVPTGNRDDTPEGSGGSRDNHTHDSAAIGGTSGGNLSDAVTYASTASDPPYYEVIYIRPSGSTATVSASIVGYWNTSSVPTGWSFCDGTAGTPDLRNRYLKGATASGDSGGTGGTLTHSHTVDHSHSASGHTHSGTSGSPTNPGDASLSAGSSTNDTHTHTITLNSTSNATSAYTSTAGSADSVEPSHKKLLAIQNTSGGVSQPTGVIGLWLGTLASIPVGWALCDGTAGTPDMRGYYGKCANLTTEAGNTGGSNTHTHAASNSHTHTSSGTHTHTGSTSTTTGPVSTGVGSTFLSEGHSHSLSTVSSPTATYQNATISGDSTNGEPLNTTVAFLQFQFEVGGGALFGLM